MKLKKGVFNLMIKLKIFHDRKFKLFYVFLNART